MVFLSGFFAGVFFLGFFLKINIDKLNPNLNKNNPSLFVDKSNKITSPSTDYLSGKIISVHLDSLDIKLHTNSSTTEGAIFNIKFNENTKFLLTVKKDSKIFENEMNNFKSGTSRNNYDFAPKPFMEVQGSIKDFTVDKMVLFKFNASSTGPVNGMVSEIFLISS